MSESLSNPDACYATIVAALRRSHPQVTELSDDPLAKGRFGSRGQLRISGKIFAMLVRGRFVVKLPKARVDALVGTGEGERFTLGPNRVMKEWLTVESTSDEEWLPLAREALAFVAAKG